jgi:hypothetical protein
MAQGSIEDRLAIRELIETFAVGVTTIDPQLWGSTWAEEGAWKTPSMPEPVQGRANIIAKFEQMLAYVRFMSMSAVPSDLDFEGERATGKAYCRELIFPKTGGQKIVVGYFADEFVRRDGQWLFLTRTYTVIGTSE